MSNPREKPPMARRRILVIDDNLDHVRTTVYLLRDSGHLVEYAINGIVGLELAQRNRPEVVVLDLKLPDGHGSEVARRLKRLPSLKDVRVVALTGSADAADHESARSAGCDEVLLKPVDPVALERAIQGRTA